MSKRSNSARSEGGFTFVEIVLGVSIFLIVSLGVYEGYRALYISLTNAHLKIVAADLVNSRFEIVRNLPYASVGIVGGNPSGVIPASQTLVRDGITWNASTTIVNVDDPFDGLAPSDARPADYKSVEVSVMCDDCRNFTPVVITGRVAPRNLEP